MSLLGGSAPSPVVALAVAVSSLAVAAAGPVARARTRADVRTRLGAAAGMGGVGQQRPQWWRLAGVSALCLAVLAFVLGPLLVAVGCAGAVVGLPALRRAARRRTLDRAGAALADVVDVLGRGVRAGVPLAAALADAAAAAPPVLADELDAVARRAGHGVALPLALDEWGRTSAVAGAPLVATALVLAADSGGDTERALERVGAGLRDRRSLQREVRALSSQARASALLIGCAPVALVAVTSVVGGEGTPYLLASPLGWACLALGVALDLAGWRWMVRLIAAVGS